MTYYHLYDYIKKIQSDTYKPSDHKKNEKFNVSINYSTDAKQKLLLVLLQYLSN